MDVFEETIYCTIKIHFIKKKKKKKNRNNDCIDNIVNNKRCLYITSNTQTTQRTHESNHD